MSVEMAAVLVAMWLAIPMVVLVFHKTAKASEFSAWGVILMVVIAAIVTTSAR